MKLIGFSQLHNEYAKGNLHWWLPLMSSVCDFVYVFDQGSTDESHQQYIQYPNVIVIYSPTNRFNEELICKQELLDRVYSEHPDVNWMLWLDGDTMLACPSDIRTTIEEQCAKYSSSPGIRFEHFNLWRSDTHYRVDDNYHWLGPRRVPLWNCNLRKLQFDHASGLHHNQEPVGITNTNAPMSHECVLLHRGFATDQSIIGKYDLYKGFGQSGRALERLLDEHGLTTQVIPSQFVPIEFANGVDPKTLTPIRQIYDQQH